MRKQWLREEGHVPKTSSCVESGLEFGSPGLSTALQTSHTAAQPPHTALTALTDTLECFAHLARSGPAVTLGFLLLAIKS